MTDRQRDRVLALLAAALAAQVVAAARGIEDSLLADAVGAGGVPQGVGIAMFVAALALFAKSFLGRPAVARTPAPPAPAAAGASWPSALLRTAGLVGILLGYGWLLPRLGYPLTVSLLVVAAGWLAGAALRWQLLLCAAVSGPALWAMFDWALQVRMPVGSLWAP